MQRRRHRTDLGTKVKSDATLIRVETDTGLIGMLDIADVCQALLNQPTG